jgi:hypothetical protein
VLDQLLVVKLVQKTPPRIGRRQLALQQSTQPLIGPQHRQVVETLAARGQQHDQRLDHRHFVAPARPLANAYMLLDRARHSQCPHRLHHQR